MPRPIPIPDTPRRRREDGALAPVEHAGAAERASLAGLAMQLAPPERPIAAPPGFAPAADSAGSVHGLSDACLRLWRRAQLPDQLVAYFDDLARAATLPQVCEVLARHSATIVGAYQAVVLAAAEAPAGGEPARLEVAGWWSYGAPPDGLAVEGPVVGRVPAVIDAGEARADTLGELRGFVDASGAASLVTVPVGGSALLLLSERRQDRAFTPDDWTALRALTTHAGHALDRIGELQEARGLALVDPLTGLANRREMDVVLRHAWAGARRGEGLTVMLLDLDDFKGINDRHGHAAGDDVLRIAAEILSGEARGSDAVVRYGGDEFLVILPRAEEKAARALLERVRRRLSGWVGVTAGIASYDPALADAEALLRTADARLYENKRRGAEAGLPAARPGAPRELAPSLIPSPPGARPEPREAS